MGYSTLWVVSVWRFGRFANAEQSVLAVGWNQLILITTCWTLLLCLPGSLKQERAVKLPKEGAMHLTLCRILPPRSIQNRLKLKSNLNFAFSPGRTDTGRGCAGSLEPPPHLSSIEPRCKYTYCRFSVVKLLLVCHVPSLLEFFCEL